MQSGTNAEKGYLEGQENEEAFLAV